jgi:putative ABC transport system permease protein
MYDGLNPPESFDSGGFHPPHEVQEDLTMRFISLVAKNLSHRPVRSILTVIGLAIALSAVMLLVGISWNFERAFLEIYTSKAIDLVVTKAGKSMNTGGILDLTVGDRLKKVEGVGDATPVLIDTVEFKEHQIDEMVVQGWVPGSLMFRGVRLVQGRTLQPGDKDAILVGDEQAGSFGKKVGDRLKIQKKSLEIVGIFESASLFERGSIVMPLSTLQSLMGYNQPATAFMIQAKDRDAEYIKALRRRIEDAFPDLSARSASDYIQNDRQIHLSRVMAWTTAGVALVVGAVGMLNTMLMSIFERTREIGLLRAVGWRRRRVLRLVLGEALFLSLGATIMGGIISAASLRALSTLPSARGFVDPNLPPTVIGIALAMGFALSVLGGLYPALRAAALDPTEALRYE